MLTIDAEASQEAARGNTDQMESIAYDVHAKVENIVHINGVSYTQASEFVMEHLDSFVKKDEVIFDSEKMHERNEGVDTDALIKILQDDHMGKFKGGEIQFFYNVHKWPDGILAGVAMVGGRGYPFVDNKIIDTIGGKAIEDCHNIHTQPNGTLAGKVQIAGKIYPFMGDEIIYTIGGKDIENCGYIHTQPNGTLAGSMLIGGIWYPFMGDEIIYTIGGKDIENCDNLHTKSDGLIAGRIQSGGEIYQFIGDYLF